MQIICKWARYTVFAWNSNQTTEKCACKYHTSWLVVNASVSTCRIVWFLHNVKLHTVRRVAWRYHTYQVVRCFAITKYRTNRHVYQWYIYVKHVNWRCQKHYIDHGCQSIFTFAENWVILSNVWNYNRVCYF